MKILVDINVIADLLLVREKHEQAVRVFDAMRMNKSIQVYVAAHEITTLSYLLEKGIKEKREIKQLLSTLLQLMTVVPLTGDILNHAFASHVDDFEDAVVECSAIHAHIQHIITWNVRDFAHSVVPALTPVDFMRKIAHAI
jgi:predicted nucleic-acid-binding protein